MAHKLATTNGMAAMAFLQVKSCGMDRGRNSILRRRRPGCMKKKSCCFPWPARKH